ncbi:MAG: hypothetical protein IJI34_03575 [Clostridia bacterium]|nr:hypothetical protein [Clostridia bacterium]
MEREMPHIVHTERCSPERRFIRSDGALYVLLLLGAFAAIWLSRVLAGRLGVNTLLVQIALYAALLCAGYWVYRVRLVDYLYELYDRELRIVQAVGAKQKTLLTIPTEAITEVGPYRKTDAKPDQRTFHGPREKTTAVWYTQNGERRVLCLCASDALKEKLTEAAHAGK